MEDPLGLAMADVLSDFYNLMPGDLDLEDEPEEKNVLGLGRAFLCLSVCLSHRCEPAIHGVSQRDEERRKL